MILTTELIRVYGFQYGLQRVLRGEMIKLYELLFFPDFIVTLQEVLCCAVLAVSVSQYIRVETFCVLIRNECWSFSVG